LTITAFLENWKEGEEGAKKEMMGLLWVRGPSLWRLRLMSGETEDRRGDAAACGKGLGLVRLHRRCRES